MADKFLVVVLGNRNSGKSETWYSLFKRKVRTSKKVRPLFLDKSQYVDVFLVNGSPQERDISIESILPQETPTIVLCSIQYSNSARRLFDYFSSMGFEIVVQWLNPGYSDDGKYNDELGLADYLHSLPATIQTQNGKHNPAGRVEILRKHIHGWASKHHAVKTQH